MQRTASKPVWLEQSGEDNRRDGKRRGDLISRALQTTIRNVAFMLSEMKSHWRVLRREMLWLCFNRVTLPAVLRIKTGIILAEATVSQEITPEGNEWEWPGFMRCWEKPYCLIGHCSWGVCQREGARLV